MKTKEIKDTFGLYLLDFSKIVFAGAFLGNFFTEIPNKYLYLSVFGAISTLLLLFGFIYLNINKTKE